MPNNSLTASDQDGEFNDWVEFYNNSNTAINVEGYFLSDRKNTPTKFTFPNLVLNPNDFLIVWLDKDTLQEGLHTNFKLTASGEQVYLFNPDRKSSNVLLNATGFSMLENQHCVCSPCIFSHSHHQYFLGRRNQTPTTWVHAAPLTHQLVWLL